MKLTIAEIREKYRNATDKDAAIKELAASEEVSEQMIKFYVRGNTGPVRPTETPAQFIAEAFTPVTQKRRGRPVKNLKPTREPATKRVEKPPKIKREYKKHAKPALVKPDTVMEEPKPKDTAVQYTHFEPVTQLEREMFFADIADDEPVELQKPQMTLLGQEVNNFDDVTRVMREAKAAKRIPEPKPWAPDPMITEENRAMREEAARCVAAPRPSSSQIITNEEVKAQPKAMTHILKCQQPYFDAVWDGHKTFEARLNDRDYKSRDSVVLKDYNPSDDTYGDRQIRADIGFLLSGEKFPFLNKQYVVFTLLNIKRYELQEVTP